MTSRTTGSKSSSTASCTWSASISSAFDGGRPAAVRHEDVDAAVGLDGSADGALEIGRLADVADDCEPAEPLRLRLEDVAPAREHDDLSALLRKRLGDGEAEPGRSSADDRRTAGEAEVHAF